MSMRLPMIQKVNGESFDPNKKWEIKLPTIPNQQSINNVNGIVPTPKSPNCSSCGGGHSNSNPNSNSWGR